MKSDPKLRTKYAQLVQGMAQELVHYSTDYRPYARDPLEATWIDNESSMRELEIICRELNIAMPFKNRFGS